MHKKSYLSPEFELMKFRFDITLAKVADSKPEDSGEYVDPGDDN